MKKRMKLYSFISKGMEWIFKYCDSFVSTVAVLCIYAILQIKFDFALWLGTSVHADKINEVITNLAYSYLAAYVFYMLTVKLPFWKMKFRCAKALNRKMRLIESNYEACAESVLPFPNHLPKDMSKDILEAIFKQFSYQEPCRLSFIGTKVSAIIYIKQKHQENKQLATELLEYKPWLRSETIAQIEEIRNSNLRAITITLTTPELSEQLSKDEGCRTMLAGAVYDLWMTAKKLKV